MEHDGERNTCSSVTSHGSIMAPLVQSRINRYMWSSCSRKELMGSIRYNKNRQGSLCSIQLLFC